MTVVVSVVVAVVMVMTVVTVVVMVTVMTVVTVTVVAVMRSPDSNFRILLCGRGLIQTKSFDEENTELFDVWLCFWPSHRHSFNFSFVVRVMFV
jgi:hypothetical protein